jgi:hypothetical protein
MKMETADKTWKPLTALKTHLKSVPQPQDEARYLDRQLGGRTRTWVWLESGSQSGKLAANPRYSRIVIGDHHDITSSASNHEEPFVDLLFQASILGNLASSKVRLDVDMALRSLLHLNAEIINDDPA